MTSPTVSVIIPAYNHENYIAASIDSVLAQSYPDFELIIVDDGSTDGTAEIIKSYNDARISYYYQDNQDAYNTINRGMSLAKGTFISILNSDDIYTSDRLEKLLKVHKETQKICIFTNIIPISETGEEITDPEFGWNIWHEKGRNYFLYCDDLYTAFLNSNFMTTTSNLFMTTEAVKKVGDFAPLRYLHDYDYIFRMLLAYPDGVTYLCNDKLLYYRIHGCNTLNQSAVVGREQDRAVIRKYLLATIPVEAQKMITAGIDRLIALEHELIEVKKNLYITATPQYPHLIKKLLGWIKKRITNKLR